MASSPTEVSLHRLTADDGVELAWHETGRGRPVVLIHGYFSSPFANWIRYGHAALIAAAGFRVIMPDLRAHDESGKPHDPAAYPPDILADDGMALIRHLGLRDADYDLGGYSLGARTTLRMLTRGARPGKAVVAGMGLHGMLHTGQRAGFFRRVLSDPESHQRGTDEWMAVQFLKTMRGDARALLLLLDSFVDTTEGDLRRIATPAIVISGTDDADNGSAEELAALLPNAAYVEIPGNHMSAVTRPELGRTIADFLTG